MSDATALGHPLYKCWLTAIFFLHWIVCLQSDTVKLSARYQNTTRQEKKNVCKYYRNNHFTDTKTAVLHAAWQKWNAKLVWSCRTPLLWILVHQITTHVIKKQSWWSPMKLQTVSVAFECLYAAVACVLKAAHDINEKQTAVWIDGSCYFLRCS